MEKGFIIIKPHELLKISRNPEVYISRKALKHFVERRIQEMAPKYQTLVIISKLQHTVSKVETIMQKPDLVDIQNSKMVYLKKLHIEDKYAIRVVIEKAQGRLQIKSIHYHKVKTTY